MSPIALLQTVDLRFRQCCVLHRSRRLQSLPLPLSLLQVVSSVRTPLQQSYSADSSSSTEGLARVAALREHYLQQMADSVQLEAAAEQKRCLESARACSSSAAVRARLAARHAREREQRRKQLQRMRTDQELVLVQAMVRLGLIR